LIRSLPPISPSHWDYELRADLERNLFNGAVGDTLLSETEKVRIWALHLKPGERINFHRHVLDYFWVAVTPGRSRSHYANGETRERDYRAGEVRHYSFSGDEYMVHDLTNIGDTDLVFTTVEFKGATGRALPLNSPAGASQ
jgi:beta-alanine degradation protein BauB